jgi:small-conductance mechanosensitive channel
MAGPKKTQLKFLGTLFGLLVAGLALIAVLSSGIPARLGLQAIWQTAYFHLGNVAVSPELLAETLIFLILLTLLTRFSRKFLRNEVLKHTALDEGQRYAIERTFGYAVLALGLFVGMQIVGLNVSSLAFLGGAVGIGVGLGLQNIASNFASGLILLLERPIKVGDRIEVGNLNGDVVRIGGRSTWVRTNDNLIIIVPNAEFTTGRVTNWTANDRRVRFSFPVGVAYGSDPEHVRTVLLALAAQHTDVLRDPAPEVLLSSFGDSSINFELRVWTIIQVQTPGRLKSDLYFDIVRQFASNGIQIPFPQRDVYIKSIPELHPAAATDLGVTEGSR